VGSDQIVIYGAGGFAREVQWLAGDCGAEAVAFVDDDAANWRSRLNDVEIMGLEEARSRFPHARMALAVGSPKVREHLARKASAAGFAPAQLIHPRVERSKWIEYGEGAVICAGSILTVNIRLGRQVQINLDCTIGHDVVMGDYATLAPGVHISGWVHIGKGAYFGSGAVVINGTQEHPLTIGDGAIVGAGACVLKSVEPGATVVGVPAKPR
jgi:sugar O-acyltransferase (sialic acid O-acetyltransferase NeuD family)